MGRTLVMLWCGAVLALPASASAVSARPVPSDDLIAAARSPIGRFAPPAAEPGRDDPAESPARRDLRIGAPLPAAPVVGGGDDRAPMWGGFAGMLERHVRAALDRASSAAHRGRVAHPPGVRPGRAGATVGGPTPPGAGGEAETAGDDSSLPTRLWFGPTYPNPSTGQVTFRIDLPAAADLHIVILDVAGRVVDDLRDRLEAGRHALPWDAQGRAGRSGIYFARLEVDGRPAGTRRLVVLR